jgi:hypothetical protein
MSTAREIGRILRVVYGKSAAERADELAALQAYALSPDPDNMGLLDALGLEGVVRAALIDMVALPEVGKAASDGQYATEIQARAYAVAMVQMTGRILVWNREEYRPHRAAGARLASLYRAAMSDLADSRAALKAKVAFPATGVDASAYDGWKRGQAVNWAP